MKDIKNFKFDAEIISDKKYKIVQLSRNLDKFTVDDFKKINDIGFFSFFGKLDDDFLSNYLFIESSIFNESLDKFKKIFSSVYAKAIGVETGSKLLILKNSIDKSIEDSLVKDVKVNQLYKVTRSDISNLVVELKEFNNDFCKCVAYAFNKEIELLIEPRYLEVCSIDYEIFRFSDNFIRINYLENSNKVLIIDVIFSILLSFLNYPNKYMDNGRFVGGFLGVYFTVLKLKQLYPDYKFVCVLGSLNFLPYYYDFVIFENFNKKDLKEIIEGNLKSSLDLFKNLGIDVYTSDSLNTREIIKSILPSFLDKDILIYSRDVSYYQFVNEKVSLYLSKICINGFDEEFNQKDLLLTLKVKDSSMVNYVLSLKNDCFYSLPKISQDKYVYVLNLLRNFNFDYAVHSISCLGYFSDFIKNSLNSNLDFFKIKDSKDYKILPSELSLDRLCKTLNENGLSKEVSMIDYIYPILVSVV